MTKRTGRGLLAALATTMATAAMAAPAAAAPRLPAPGPAPDSTIGNASSSNWAGYSAEGGGFHSVSAAWVQPAVSCRGGDAYSSFWVGIDGDGSNTVEQTGTAAECHGGRPVYYAWWEMYPQPVKPIAGLAVRPGDRFKASVTTSDGTTFVLKIRNLTTGQRFTTTKRSTAARLASAEVIAEAPSLCSASGCFVAPLADFGRVNFTSATVNGQPISASRPVKINMVGNGYTKATTSALSGGQSFSVVFNHA